jgi:hypothetical protein
MGGLAAVRSPSTGEGVGWCSVIVVRWGGRPVPVVDAAGMPASRGVPAGYGVGSAQPQQRSGSARRRMNAAARVCAHGQVLQTHDQAAGVAADAGGDVQQPVAQRLGFADRELAVQQQRLGPAAKVAGHQDQLQPDGVAAPPVKRQVAQAGGLGAADAVLHPGALAVAQLQGGQVGSGWSVRRLGSGARRRR